MQHVSHLSWEADCQMKLSDETDTQVSSVTRTVSMGLGGTWTVGHTTVPRSKTSVAKAGKSLYLLH